MKENKSRIIHKITKLKKIYDLWKIHLTKKPKIVFAYFSIWVNSIISPNKQIVLPWMTFGAIDWFEKKVKKDFRVFEWGSGGSTLYWVNKAEYVCSTEHDNDWYKQITNKLADTGLSNYDYRLMVPEKDPNNSNYRSSSEKFEGQSFEKYCRAIESFPDNYFDLIIIDGRARVACAKLAEKKVKSGGYVVLDNADIKEYSSIFEIFSKYKKIIFNGPGLYSLYPWETVIFNKNG